MNFDPETASALIQWLMAGLLGIVIYLGRQALTRLERLERAQIFNTGRLIRIETRLGIHEPLDYASDDDS